MDDIIKENQESYNFKMITLFISFYWRMLFILYFLVNLDHSGLSWKQEHILQLNAPA